MDIFIKVAPLMQHCQKAGSVGFYVLLSCRDVRQILGGHFINRNILVIRIKIVGFDGFNYLTGLFGDESDVSLPFE